MKFMTIEDKPKTTDIETTTMNCSFEPSVLTVHCHQQSEGKLSESFWSRNYFGKKSCSQNIQVLRILISSRIRK